MDILINFAAQFELKKRKLRNKLIILSMKQYFVKGATMLFLGGFLASCSHEEFDISTYVADKVKAYEEVFVKEYGTIDPNQDWGFGSVTRNGVQTKGLTRAAEQWTLSHNDSWMSYLNFTKPSGCIEVTSGNSKLSGSNTYYVPSSYTGSVDFDNFNGKLYIDGTITSFSGNAGNMDLYILDNGTWNVPNNSFTTGTITVYNRGTLILPSWAFQNQNMKTVYNGGYFKLGKAGESPNFADGVSFYSNSNGEIDIIGDVDLKFECDVHGTMNISGDVKIQNSRTQYICKLIVAGHLEMTQGKLETSYVGANDIKFDGAEIWLLPQGHVYATESISMPNSATYIHGHSGDIGLVETRNFYFQNTNNFDDSFSSNIYFSISGEIDYSNSTKFGGGGQHFNSASDYLASSYGQDLAGRLNTGVSVSPDCGASGSNTPTPPSGGGDIDIPVDEPTITTTTTEKIHYKTTQLIEQGRIFCEDLGRINANDLDFNDVVFDAYIYKVDYSTETIVNGVSQGTEATRTEYEYEITLWAAGGTLPLTVAGEEVHNAFGYGESVATIINTATDESEAYGNPWKTDCAPKTLTGTGYKTIEEIPVITQYSNGTILWLEAPTGEVPHKICVPIGTPWSKERNKIVTAYPSFQDYVNNQTSCWTNVGSGLYKHPQDNASPRSTDPVGPVQVGYESTTDSSTSGGGYNGTEVLSRPLK